MRSEPEAVRRPIFENLARAVGFYRIWPLSTSRDSTPLAIRKKQAIRASSRFGSGVYNMRWVGRPLPRYEDPILLQGRGRYTADLAQSARRLRFMRSPVARGRILAVNAPPEVSIITAAALGEVKPICPRLDRPDYVPVAQPILARERVNYVGEPIAAVIADTAAGAEDLAEQLTVEIAAEPPVVTLDEALALDAPLVHDAAARNTLIDARFETAGVAVVFAAAHQVVEFTFTSGRQAAVPLETRAAVAAFDPVTGRVTLGRRRKCRTYCAPALPTY
jgi:carbon-monoxide dehydrogenase large subunit